MKFRQFEIRHRPFTLEFWAGLLAAINYPNYVGVCGGLFVIVIGLIGGHVAGDRTNGKKSAEFYISCGLWAITFSLIANIILATIEMF